MNIFILATCNNKYSNNQFSFLSFENGKSILDWQTNAFETSILKKYNNIFVDLDYHKIIS